MIDFSKFDSANVVTDVNLALLGGNRGPLKALAGWNKGHRHPVHARMNPKCPKCKLKRRSIGHTMEECPTH